MKNFSMRLLRVVAVLALGALLSTPVQTRAAERDLGTHAATVTVPSKLAEAEVEAAIVQSLMGRRWIVREKKDGEIVAYYERGNNSATLTIRYDDKKVEIYGIGKSRGGGLPTRWVDNLKRDIELHLGRALLNK